jgi:CRISPR-associated protein Csm4
LRYFRVNFELASSHGTPFLADTIFGHFCWAIAFTEGEGALQEFLSEFDEGVPLLVSDGFPAVFDSEICRFYLPKPILIPEKDDIRRLESELGIDEERKTKLRLQSAVKLIDKKPWISESVFSYIKGELTWYKFVSSFLKLEVCPKACTLKSEVGCVVNDWMKCPGLGMKDSEGLCTNPASPGPISVSVIHNVVNRLSNTAEDPFTLEEIFPVGKMHFITRIDDNIVTEDRLRSWMEFISINGYGRDATTGKGAIKAFKIEPVDSPISDEHGSFLNISSAYVPKAGELPPGSYAVHVKHGKLGSYFAVQHSPWKKPILMIKAGAVFHASPKRDYGQLLRHVHYTLTDVAHYGYAFPLGVTCHA